MTLKSLHKLICLLPYYFIIVIILSYLGSANYNIFDTPPPDPKTGLSVSPFKTEALMFRLLYSHVIGLVGYTVASFPITIITTILLLRKNESSIITTLVYLAYLSAAVGLLLSPEIYNLIKN